jgi:uncharacterized protein (TIGR03086 family)
LPKQWFVVGGMDAPDLLPQGYAWTADRIAAVPADGLDAPTPCSGWTLREVLDHIIDVLTMLTDAVDGPASAASGAGGWGQALASLAARSRRAWAVPGVMDRTLTLPTGPMPAPVAAWSSLLELVVHGWDVGQATGETIDIPDELAVPVLRFARGAIGDADRGDNFAANLGLGDTPSEQLVAFLGRKPL